MGESRCGNGHDYGVTMNARDKRISELKQKYGDSAVDTAMRLHGSDVPDAIDWADDLDPYYTKLWLDFTYGGLFKRGVLDDRTRTLVIVGQFVAMDELEELPIHIR